MRIVPLSRFKVALIDNRDYLKVKKHSWCATKIGTVWYAQSRIKGKIVYLHHFIFGEGLIDHKDRDGLNNQRTNLRWATRSDNQHNRKKQRNNTSGFKGVFWNKVARKWEAALGLNGKKVYLGLFTTKISAARQYNTSATAYYGKFANLNPV